MSRPLVALRALALMLILSGWGAVPASPGQEASPTAPGRSIATAESRPGAMPAANQLDAIKATLGMVRTLIVGFLALAIQAGFILVAVGLTRAKNASHTSGQILLGFAIGVIGFWACGFALMFGGAGHIVASVGDDVLGRMASIHLGEREIGLFGYEGFFLSQNPGTGSALWLFLLQLGFLGTAAIIPTGSLAERWRMKASCLFGLAISMLIYPIFGCWAWGGGWLAGLGTNFGIGNGFVDFAGSGVVHLTGGVAALVGSSVVGPRIGKYRRDGMPNPIPGHNIPLVIVGSLLLASAWIAMGANGGRPTADMELGPMAVRALLAAVSGCLGSCLYAWLFFGRPDPTLCCNGLLAGVVAISAPCAFVSPIGATVIGGLAGLLAIGGILAVERILRVDDPVGAVSVHAACGAFGCLCVGLFATGEYGKGWNGVADVTPMGILYGGGLGQLAAQAIGILANLLWVAPTSYAAFRAIDALVGNRVSARVEVEGLDIPETGVLGYVVEETHVVATAGQVYLASHGPGVPERTSLGPPSRR
ncbi:ammonium transporter [Tundrisphaera sp. TA3]|uniref:ammonium transporter n=1 Tax=Tundrisphaera sp. TA3 TaxID=3435775 RepID=UPI003EBF129F